MHRSVAEVRHIDDRLEPIQESRQAGFLEPKSRAAALISQKVGDCILKIFVLMR
jgi:hypothetical protein